MSNHEGDYLSYRVGLCNNGDVLTKNSIKNKEVETLNDINRDQRALIIDKIINPAVRYVAYDISYKVYFRNREGATLTIVVYMAHMLVMEDKSFDLCELLR